MLLERIAQILLKSSPSCLSSRDKAPAIRQLSFPTFEQKELVPLSGLQMRAQNVETFEWALRIASPFSCPHLSPKPIEKLNKRIVRQMETRRSLVPIKLMLEKRLHVLPHSESQNSASNSPSPGKAGPRCPSCELYNVGE